MASYNVRALALGGTLWVSICYCVRNKIYNNFPKVEQVKINKLENRKENEKVTFAENNDDLCEIIWAETRCPSSHFRGMTQKNKGKVMMS